MISSDRKFLDTLLQERRHALRKVQEEKAALKEARRKLRNIQEAQQIAQTVAQHVQQQVHKRISSIVSHCLAVVFDDPYVFQITFERKRGRTAALLQFVRDGHVLSPRTESSGGMLEVAAFALRVARLKLSRPSPRLFLALDEPFRCLHQDKFERVRELLLGLAEELGIQILMITQEDGLRVGKVVEL